MARATLLTVIAAACIFAVMHVTDIGAAIVRAIDGASGRESPLATSPAPSGSIGAPAFSGGKCVTFPAAGVPSGQSVFVDPGHGGPDPGAVGEASGKPVQEKVVTLAVARRLTALLQNDGYRVIMSRTGDSSVAGSVPSDGGLSPDDIRRDLLARIACANASGANLLVSIHFNGSDDASVAGSEAFYDSMRPFSAANHRLAIDLERSITAAIGTTNLGVWPDDQNVGPALSPAGAVYGHLIELGPPSPGYVDVPSQMPGALVEPLFLTNANEAKQAADPLTQQLLATAIDAGVRAYFGGA